MGNKLMRRMVTLLVAAAMIMTSGMFAFAASGSPTTGKVTKVSSVGARSGKTLTISWKVDNKATKYKVKVGKKVYTTTKTSLKVNTKAGQSYKITVTPVYGSKNGKAKSATSRWMKTTTVTKATPAKKAVKLTWKKVAGATRYQILQYKNGKWTVVASVKGTSKTIKVAKKGSYKFRVRPVKGTYYGVESAVKTGKAK